MVVSGKQVTKHPNKQKVCTVLPFTWNSYKPCICHLLRAENNALTCTYHIHTGAPYHTVC